MLVCAFSWEQRKLGDITSKIGSGKTPLGGNDAYVNDGIYLIRSQNVHDDIVDLSDVVFIDEETDISMSNSRVITGDVLLNITGASIGRSAVYIGIIGSVTTVESRCTDRVFRKQSHGSGIQGRGVVLNDIPVYFIEFDNLARQCRCIIGACRNKTGIRICLRPCRAPQG